MLAELLECVKSSWHHCTERAKICKIEKKRWSAVRDVDSLYQHLEIHPAV